MGLVIATPMAAEEALAALKPPVTKYAAARFKSGLLRLIVDADLSFVIVRQYLGSWVHSQEMGYSTAWPSGRSSLGWAGKAVSSRLHWKCTWSNPFFLPVATGGWVVNQGQAG